MAELDLVELLLALETAYYSGVTSVSHGDKRVQYASLSELWLAILRLRKAVAPSSHKYISGRAGYSKYS